MPRVRTATASLAAAVTVLLAALGPRYVRSFTEVAVFTALCLTFLGSIACFDVCRSIFQGTRVQWSSVLTAIGGFIILTIGTLHAVAFEVALDRGMRVATFGMLIAIPIAVGCCLLGGLAQLPRSWLPISIPIICGAPLVSMLSMGTDTWITRASTGSIAFLTGVACLIAFRRISRVSLSTDSAFASLALLLLVAIMTYAVFVASTPVSWWQNLASPKILAAGYGLVAFMATLAGLMYKERPDPMLPQ